MIKRLKIYKIIKKFIAFNTNYGLFSQSAEISFYMITSVLSILVVLVQILNSNDSILSNLLFSEITQIFSESFLPLINQMIPKFRLSSFSIIIFINIVWSSSAVLNKYNKISDRLYGDEQRNFVINRINSILMFMMLSAFIIFYLILIIYLVNLIKNVLLINSKFIINIFMFLAEILFIFLLLTIIYINAPPYKMKAKNVILGSIISTLLIYIIFVVFVFLVKVLAAINPAISITFILSFSLLLLFTVNYIIILGLLINYMFCKKWNELKYLINS